MFAKAGNAIIGHARRIDGRRKIVGAVNMEIGTRSLSQPGLRTTTVGGPGNRLQRLPSNPRTSAFISYQRSPAASKSTFATGTDATTDRSGSSNHHYTCGATRGSKQGDVRVAHHFDSLNAKAFERVF